MAGLRLRGWEQFNVGRLLITVPLDPPTTHRNFEQHSQLAEITERLVRRLSSHSLPATWGLCDPAQSAATATIVSNSDNTGVAHEIAVLGDDAWIGATAGRPRFAKELVRRFEQARAHGIVASTLLYRGDGPVDHLDLLVKNNVSALSAVDVDPQALRPIVLPKALRYAVWDLRVTGLLPTTGFWFAGRRMMRRIRQATDEGAMFHLLIDAPTVVQQGRAAEDSLARIVQQISMFRDRGLLELETMSTAAARLSEVPLAKPQRSILRMAG